MALAMASPTRHPRTGIFQHIVRVPKDVATLALGRKVSVPVGSGRRDIVLGAVAKVSLATRDPGEAKVRFVAVADALNFFYGGLREGPVTLSHKRRQVIAGAIYHEALAEYEEEPGSAAKWREMASILEKHAVGDHDGVDDMREMFFGDRVTDALAERGLVITTESRRDLLKDVVEPFSWFLRDIAAAADKDYTRRRFPTDTDDSPSPKRPRRPKGKAVSFSDIIDERVRRKSAGRDGKGASAATIAIFRRATKHFSDWRKSDDATTVTRQEVEGWMAARQAEAKVGNRTISQHVVNVGTVWGWGRKHDGAAFPKESPFTGIERPDFDTIAPSERAFRLDEARAILHAARKETEPGKRWLPFIAAYSGARISELSFLRPDDFRQVEGNWFFRIDDSELRAVKTKSSRRTIPACTPLRTSRTAATMQRPRSCLW